MKILIDNTVVKTGQGGVRSVATNLTTALTKLPGIEVHVISTAGEQTDWGPVESVHIAKLRNNSALQRAAWRTKNMQEVAEATRADVIFTPSPELVKVKGIASFSMIHDLGPLIAPALYGWPRFARYAATVPRLVKEASGVLCVSQTTRLDAIRWCGEASAGSLKVLTNAPQPLVAEPRRPSGVSPGEVFCLYVGAYLPHKNVRTILRGVSEGNGDIPRLICVGPDYAGERARLEREYAKYPEITFLGFVEASELRWLYEAAHAVLMPSLFEGFGMPVLEALCLGGRVVSSPLPVYQELVGAAIEYISDPLDPSVWRRAMDKGGRSSGSLPPAVHRTWSDVAADAIKIFESA